MHSSQIFVSTLFGAAIESSIIKTGRQLRKCSAYCDGCNYIWNITNHGQLCHAQKKMSTWEILQNFWRNWLLSMRSQWPWLPYVLQRALTNKLFRATDVLEVHQIIMSLPRKVSHSPWKVPLSLCSCNSWYEGRSQLSLRNLPFWLLGLDGLCPGWVWWP